PKDDTPGCTKEAEGFAEAYPEFQAAGIQVVGVSKDSAASHDRFKAKYRLPFPLASDAEGGVVEAYGSWVEKSRYGKKYMGIDRSTFLIDGSGTLQKVWRGVKVPGHVAEVLAAAKALGPRA
ncbi:MAG: peroxiredoxin, partial [Geminicoccaceae bacterium]